MALTALPVPGKLLPPTRELSLEAGARFGRCACRGCVSEKKQAGVVAAPTLRNASRLSDEVLGDQIAEPLRNIFRADTTPGTFVLGDPMLTVFF